MDVLVPARRLRAYDGRIVRAAWFTEERLPPVQAAQGAGGLEALLCPWEREWMEGDFDTGDVLTFPSFTVHKALPALEKDLVRISLDVRYQSIAEPIENASLLPHVDLSWEEIYANWKSDELKYYWRDQQLTITPFDQAYLQFGRRIC